MDNSFVARFMAHGVEIAKFVVAATVVSSVVVVNWEEITFVPPYFRAVKSL